LKHDASTCTAGAEDTTTDLSTQAAAETGDNFYIKCSKACYALNDDCFEFAVNDANSTCTAYSGTCTSTAGAANDRIFVKAPCCYWSTPLKVITDSGCNNKAETTMNGAASVAAYEFTSAANNYNVVYDKMTCQKLCLNTEDC
jgi:hypothetical protein